MNRSPLQLKHYHFVTLALAAQDSYDPASFADSEGPYPDFDGILLQPEVSLFSNDEAGERGPFLLRLALGYEPEAGELPYSFEVVIEGVFGLAEEAEFSDCKRTVVVNGASILYSAAREQLMMLSSRHIYGPMMLPTLDFRQIGL
ncbi:hypothetical protein VF673_12270 [Halopseudomonas sp. Lyrl_26]|uniref:hypothetical protein n=1 Tax=Halopseudomonas sp. Lyrl_26 TaxID=3110923 RepID=UPI003F81F24B